MSKAATLRDIAKALNVSVTTVSRALNDKDDISKETKNAVREVAQMLGYKPNYWARHLAADKNANIIGVVLPRIDHYFYATIMEGITTALSDHSHYVLFGDSHDDAHKEMEVIQHFLDLRLAGLILAPAINSRLNDIIKEVKSHHSNLVVIDRASPDIPCNSIVNDDFNAAYQCVTHLFNQGYQRIAHIRGPEDCLIAAQRCNGYQSSLERHYGTHDLGLVVTCGQVTIEAGYKGMKSLMELDIPPDAVFCISDEAALGVYRYAKEHNINIPQDLGVVGFSNSQISQHLNPSLTTVDQYSHRMGREAVEMIVGARAEIPKTINKIFQPTLIIRDSSQHKHV